MNLRSIAATLLALVVLTFAGAGANAQTAPPANASVWTSIGPQRTTYPNGSGGFFEMDTSGKVEAGRIFVVEPGAKASEPAGKPSGSRVDFGLR